MNKHEVAFQAALRAVIDDGGVITLYNGQDEFPFEPSGFERVRNDLMVVGTSPINGRSAKWAVWSLEIVDDDCFCDGNKTCPFHKYEQVMTEDWAFYFGVLGAI